MLLASCSFSIRALPAPTSPATDGDIREATATLRPVLPPISAGTATPTLIPIRADTLAMLEIFKSFTLKDMVRALAFSPDGTALAAAGGNTDDFSIHLWDVVKGRSLPALDGHSSILWGLAFSPDGELLASVSSDRTAKVWDWRAGQLLKTLEFPGEMVSVSFSPDGQTLAVGGVDVLEGQIQHATIWTFLVGSWEPLVKFPEYLNIAAMAYSPRGRILVGGGSSRNVQVWRTSDGAPVYTLNHAHQVSKAAISPDGSTVATATCETVLIDECAQGAVWLWDLETGRLRRKLIEFSDTVESLAFLADGSALVAASRDGLLRFYDTASYHTLFEFNAPGGVNALALAPDGGLLASANVRGEVYLWKIVYRP